MTNATPSPSAPPSAPAATTTAAASVQAGAAKVDPESLRLRAAPRAVMRLNRRMLAALVGTLGVLVLGGTLWSLQSPKRVRTAAPELHNVDKVARAEHLERLPKDYGKWPGTTASSTATVPVLGEPLPGDLGAAMHAKRVADNGAYAPAGQMGGTGGISEADEAARSGVFFKGGGAGKVASASAAPATSVGGATLSEPMGGASPFQALNGLPVPPAAGSAAGSAAATSDPTALQNRQEQKQAFAANASDAVNRNPGSLQLPVSPYQVMAGTIIPAALVTGINSDLPGQVIANVTEAVYDTATGRYLLVPQGSRLIGRYDSQVAFGQRRVLLVWTRLILPDTSSIALDRLPGIDPAGYAGLEDGVDWHWDRILVGAALSTLLGVGAELAAPDNRNDGNRASNAARQSAQDTVNEVGQEITKRNASIQPTLTIRPGFPMRVMVNKDLILRPYQPLFFVRGVPP
jgi:type IV secretion system protein TrbI